jgi:hypothetical protein
MLRVTPVKTKEGETVKLEGKLCGPWVEEVQRFWSASAASRSVRIDLEEVTYVDQKGKELLWQMEKQGASLVRASEFINHLLHDDAIANHSNGASRRGEK